MKISNPSVAVVICTIPKRNKKLIKCINSIYKKNTLPEEIYVVCNDNSNFILPKTVKIIQTKLYPASVKKNLALKYCKSEIIAFTDDDCIVQHTWIQTIKKTFSIYPKIDLLFGPVKAYLPDKKSGFYCPSTFTKPGTKIFIKPQIHQNIGSGNNFAIRKNVLMKLGGFKTWLSPGSIGKSAEDAELIIRALSQKYQIMYLNSQNIVWHNRWLSEKEYQKQELDYLLADTICYAYYLFKYSFAVNRICNRWKINIWRYAHSIKLLLKKTKQPAVNSLFHAFTETLALIKGISIGIFYRIFSS